MLSAPWTVTWLSLTVYRRWVVAVALCSLIPTGVEAAWTTTVRPDPMTRQARCLLVSDPQMTSDGYDSTPVVLMLDDTQLRVITESVLDASFADLQLIVDKDPPIHSTTITHQAMVLVFDQALPKLIERFRAGKQATVYLRFWPTWPATQSFPIVFSLAGFSKAYDHLLQGCPPTK